MGEGIGGLSMGIKVAIAAAVIVLVAVGVGAKVSQNKQKNDAAGSAVTSAPVGSTTNPNTVSAPKLQSDIVIDPATGSWNNFDNNKAGVSLRFPNNWIGKTIDDNTVEFREAGKTYTVSGKDTYAVLVKFEANTGAKAATAVAAEKMPKATKSSVDVSGYTASRVEDSSNISTYFATPTNIITLVTPKGIADTTVQQTYNQMVKTLIFLQN